MFRPYIGTSSDINLQSLVCNPEIDIFSNIKGDFEAIFSYFYIFWVSSLIPLLKI